MIYLAVRYCFSTSRFGACDPMYCPDPFPSVDTEATFTRRGVIGNCEDDDPEDPGAACPFYLLETYHFTVQAQNFLLEALGRVQSDFTIHATNETCKSALHYLFIYLLTLRRHILQCLYIINAVQND